MNNNEAITFDGNPYAYMFLRSPVQSAKESLYDLKRKIDKEYADVVLMRQRSESYDQLVAIYETERAKLEDKPKETGDSLERLRRVLGVPVEVSL